MTFEGFFALRRRGKENRMNGNFKIKNVIIGQSVSLASKPQISPLMEKVCYTVALLLIRKISIM